MTSSGIITGEKSPAYHMHSRNDYELFIKLKVKEMPISDKLKKIVRQMAMDGFDDGFTMHRDGEIEVDNFKEFKCRT